MKRVRGTAVILGLSACGAVVGFAGGCKTTVDVKPIEVKPIHLTVDVNIKHVDNELDKFFDFEGKAPVQNPSTSPAQSAPNIAPATQGVAP